MPDLDDELRTLRRRHDDLLEQVDRAPTPARPGNPSIVVKTVTVASYPTGALKVYGVQRATISGTEAEGSAVSLSASGPTFYALDLGNDGPPLGTYLVADLISGRWVMRFDG